MRCQVMLCDARLCPRNSTHIALWATLLLLAATASRSAHPIPSSALDAHRRGAALYDAGQALQALPLFEEAVQDAPNVPEFLLARGVARAAAGLLAEARADLKRVAHDPTCPAHLSRNALLALGQTCRGLADSACALRAYEAALPLLTTADEDPGVRGGGVGARLPLRAKVQYNMARCLREIDRVEEAESILRGLVAEHPQHANSQSSLGALLLHRGDARGARRQFITATQLDPDASTHHANLATACERLEDMTCAERALHAALRLRASDFAVRARLGDLLHSIGNLTAARHHLLRAAEGAATATFQPARPALVAPLASAEEPQSRRVSPDGLLFRALTLLPVIPSSTHSVARARERFAANLLQLAAHQALHAPHVLAARQLLATAREVAAAVGAPAVDEPSWPAIEAWASAAAGPTLAAWLQRRGRLTLDDPVLDLGHLTNFQLPYQRLNVRHHQRLFAAVVASMVPGAHYVARALQSAATAQQPPCAVPPSEPVRVGVVSMLFREHSVSKLFAGVVAGLGRLEDMRVTAFMFSQHRRRMLRDRVTDYIEHSVHRVVHLPHDLTQARAAIEAERPHVLLYSDLGQDTATYLLAMSRLAPVQAVFAFGHPATSGIPSIDVAVSSATFEPVHGDANYGEHVARLPSLTAAFHRPPSPPVRDRAYFGLPATGALYACLQSLFKLHPDFDDLLFGVLAADPTGSVVLLADRSPNLEWLLRRRWSARADHALVGRIVILPRQQHADYLALVRLADAVLDPLPMAGGVTSFEALAMLAPVVTLPSAVPQLRFTKGMYERMGVTDLVARSPQHYVALAVRLGTVPRYRAMLVERIARRVHVIFEDADAVAAWGALLRRLARDGQWQCRSFAMQAEGDAPALLIDGAASVPGRQ